MIDYYRRYLFLSVISFSATKEIKHNCANLYEMPNRKRKNSCLALTDRYFSRVVRLRSDLWNPASTGYRIGLSRSYCTCCIFNLDNVIDFDSVLFDQISDERSAGWSSFIFTVFTLRLNHTPFTQLIYGPGVRLLPGNMREYDALPHYRLRICRTVCRSAGAVYELT